MPVSHVTDVAPSRRRWIWLAVAVIAVIAAVVFAHAITHVTPISGRAWTPGAKAAARRSLLVDIGVWWALFAIAVAALLRAPVRASVAVALSGGVALGVASLARVAILSNDLYRYAWDGKVQAAGIDPYRYAPVAPQLDRLHDGWLWPSAAGCASRGRLPGCTLINRPTVHTIYPPAAQLYFRVAHLIVPESWQDRGYEALGLLLALVVAGMVLLLLTRWGRDPRWVALWALCPAVSLEAVQNAHVDVVAVIAVCGALLVVKRHVLVAAALVAVAALTKLYPLVLFPAVVRSRRLAGAALVAGLIAVAYLPYVVNTGRGVTSFWHGYLQQEGYGNGSRFALLELIGLHGNVAIGIAGVVVASLLVLAWRGRLGPPHRATAIVFIGVLLTASPGEPWEDLLVVALIALTGLWQWLGVVLADYVGYLTSVLGGHSRPVLSTAYGAALLVGVVVSVIAVERRRRSAGAS